MGGGVGMGVGVAVDVGVTVGDTMGVAIKVGDNLGVGVGGFGLFIGSGVLEGKLAADDPPPQAISMLPITASDKMMDDILFTDFSPSFKTDRILAI